VCRALVEEQADEKDATLSGEVEAHAVLLLDAKRPAAALSAGVMPPFSKGAQAD
jgi:hypothetical protein